MAAVTSCENAPYGDNLDSLSNDGVHDSENVTLRESNFAILSPF